ncbi:hypothetical protein BDZ90DRAFT_106771 [Jaminaea rosea]|uniref:C2H2-type domain-containing protein n=1 Tax=Jaminaea rosea TaxID=1569628 RepID=A0A316UVN9_9BASI|nr:hypothetical protein BDZ90DRAFT_106771 [Jaminaea rosea]PWN29367.1 hypothetical protein BDZ90DRAFT_106771 [Jaminaea rosea]
MVRKTLNQLTPFCLIYPPQRQGLPFQTWTATARADPCEGEGRVRLPCDECGQTFVSQTTLDQHKALHAERKAGKTYPCTRPGCGKVCTTRALWKAHEKVHDKETFSCPRDCGSVFTVKSARDRHVLHQHEGKEKTLRCTRPGCEKVFSDRTRLKEHEATHEERPRIPCPKSRCSKSYVKLQDVKIH